MAIVWLRTGILTLLLLDYLVIIIDLTIGKAKRTAKEIERLENSPYKGD